MCKLSWSCGDNDGDEGGRAKASLNSLAHRASNRQRQRGKRGVPSTSCALFRGGKTNPHPFSPLLVSPRFPPLKCKVWSNELFRRFSPFWGYNFESKISYQRAGEKRVTRKDQHKEESRLWEDCWFYDLSRLVRAAFAGAFSILRGPPRTFSRAVFPFLGLSSPASRRQRAGEKNEIPFPR